MEYIGYILRWITDIVAANLASFLSALSGTFLGAYFAFLFERRERQGEVEEKQVGAINRGLYTIYRMWNVLRQYQREHLNEFRERPDRWLNLTANPLAAQVHAQLEAGELSFLLTKEANTFAGIMLEEQRFNLAIGLIDQRSKLMLAEVFPRMERANVRVGDQRPVGEVESILGTALTQQLKQSTDQIIDFVDGDVNSLERAFEELRAAAKRLYPKRDFIRVDFNPPP